MNNHVIIAGWDLTWVVIVGGAACLALLPAQVKEIIETRKRDHS